MPSQIRNDLRATIKSLHEHLAKVKKELGDHAERVGMIERMIEDVTRDLSADPPTHVQVDEEPSGRLL